MLIHNELALFKLPFLGMFIELVTAILSVFYKY